MAEVSKRKIVWSVGCLVLFLATVLMLYLAAKKLAMVEKAELNANAAIRDAGEPVSPEDLIDVWAPGDPETLSWLRAFGNMPSSWTGKNLDMTKAEDVATLIESLRGDASATDEVALLGAWVECLGNAPEVARLKSDLGRKTLLDQQRPASEFTDCEITALRVFYDLAGPRLERALEVEHRGPVELRIELRRLIDVKEPEFPDFYLRVPIAEYFQVTTELCNVALLAAIEGRSAESVRLFELSLHATSLLSNQSVLIANLAVSQVRTRAMTAIENSLPYLAKDADVSSLFSAMEAWDLNGDLKRSISAERAMSNRLFDLMRASVMLDFDLSRWKESLPIVLGLDDYESQIVYLEYSELGLDLCDEKSFPEVVRGLRLSEADLAGRGNPQMLRFVLASHEQSFVLRFRVEAQRQLARHAQIARRDGIEAAMVSLATTIDPLSGIAFQNRIEPNGALVMWSVGPDGVSNEAKWASGIDAHDDIVWRFTPGIAWPSAEAR